MNTKRKIPHISQRLWDRQQEIDRIRKQVDWTVKMVLGLVLKHHPLPRPFDDRVICHRSGCRWILGYYVEGRPKFWAECQMRQGLNSEFDFLYTSRMKQDHYSVPARFTELVYGTLDGFINAMIYRFPEIEKDLRKFLMIEAL